jgi:predicted nuclease of predicted toxin-antitoxin system
LSLLLYADNNVNDHVVLGLRRLGYDVLRARDDGMAEALDETVLQRATALGRVVYTNDADIVRIAKSWETGERHHAGIIYTHQDRLSVRRQIEELQLVIEAMHAEEIAGTLVRIPL